MTLLDGSGRPQEFLSSGMTAEEARQLWELPDGRRLFEHLGSITEPLRLPDLLGHVRFLGFSEFLPPVAVGPVVPFLAAPVFHRGERVGNLYVAEKKSGGAFTQEDEETLVLFASQAALVIANARRYRDEQRARTDLETLIDTSPVGVAVFDARTGAPVSFNREVRRIVEGLRMPDPTAGAAAGGVDRSARRRARGLAPGIAGCRAAVRRGDGARRGDRPRSPRRSARRRAAQRHAHPRGGRRGRVLCRDPAGPDAPGGPGAAAGGVPGDGQPRAARAADLDPGLGDRPAGLILRPGPGRDAPVPPHHPRADRHPARAGRRPARRGPHRDRHAAGSSRACRGLRPGGPGPKHLPERRRKEPLRHRPGPGSPPGDGRPAAHRSGHRQPAVQRRPALARDGAHPG